MIVRPGSTRSSNHSPLTCQSNCIIKKKNTTVKPLIIVWPVMYSTRQRKKLHLTYYKRSRWLLEENIDHHKQLDFTSLYFLCIPHPIHPPYHHNRWRKRATAIPTAYACGGYPVRVKHCGEELVASTATVNSFASLSAAWEPGAGGASRTPLPCKAFSFWERAGQILPHRSS